MPSLLTNKMYYLMPACLFFSPSVITTPNMYKQWESDVMKQAMAACVEGKKSIYAAAKEYNVPRTTLSQRVRGKVDLEASAGRPKALSTDEENSLVNYIKYMHTIRFPVDRSQVIGIAWAIDLKRDVNDRVFKETGPSLKWWRGFKKRHNDLKLCKTESIDRGRHDNATEEIVEQYFDVLEETITTNNLKTRPHLIFNCDESALDLNKSSKRVLIPRSSKHSHTISTATSQHVSVLCCASAAGQSIPPLIIFSKGMPAGRRFQDEGPINAAYSHSDSGFIDRQMYTDWFNKVFLRHAPRERPLLLLQDGATAHISADLIDSAIANEVILLCFPPKLTHILQPCDVVIYRKMKAEVSKIMRQVKMLRGDLWVNKSKVPAVFREALDNAFTPAIIREAFRKCGIYPFDWNAIDHDLIKKKSPAPVSESCVPESNTRPSDQSEEGECRVSAMNSTSCEGEVIANVTLDVISPSDIPDGSQIVVAGSSHDNTSLPCPPSVALRAVEMTLTPRKKAAYSMKDTKGVIDNRDPVYSTWRYLKHQVDPSNTERSSLPSLEDEENPLVVSGLIPRRLVDVMRTPISTEKQARRRVAKAQVITSEELSAEIREKDNKRKMQAIEKEERKKARLAKKGNMEKKSRKSQRRKNNREKNVKDLTQTTQDPPDTNQESLAAHSTTVNNGNHNRDSVVTNLLAAPSVRVPLATPGCTTERHRYFSHVQSVLISCNSYEAMKSVCPRAFPYDIELNPPSLHDLKLVPSHQLSEVLLARGFPTLDLRTVDVLADGNCLPRSGSFVATGSEDSHLELRVRLVQELLLHDSCYLDDDFLAQGKMAGTSQIAAAYAQFSPSFVPGTKLGREDIRKLYENEVQDVIRPNTFCGMWQIHALSSVLSTPIRSLFPGLGPHKADLCRDIIPRVQKTGTAVHILWTSTINCNLQTWWDPNHFVPAFPTQDQAIPSNTSKVKTYMIPTSWYCIDCLSTHAATIV